MAEWLERAVPVREFSGSSPDRGRHKKTFAGVRGPSDYVIFRRVSIHSLQTFYTLELDLRPFPTDVTHFLPNIQ